MIWNWEKTDWPNFTWDASVLRKAEEQFLLGTGLFAGTMKHLNEQDQEQLTIDAIGSEAINTSEIEGEMLDRASVQSSIRRQLGLATDRRRVKPAEQGIAEMMVGLYRTYASPLSDDMLFAWHKMLTNGRRDLTNIGRYRTDDGVVAFRLEEESEIAAPKAEVLAGRLEFLDVAERLANYRSKQ